jgi:NAD(P)-dependent dehydrogenase (short-subunit alcohol dehydrogenase family)
VPYATEKWGLVGMVKSAALELGRNNITVNAVAPTGVVTDFGGPQTPQQRAQGDEFFRTQYHALPVGALQPEDIGGTVVFLASPAARYITGAVIDVAAGANARYTG